MRKGKMSRIATSRPFHHDAQDGFNAILGDDIVGTVEIMEQILWVSADLENTEDLLNLTEHIEPIEDEDLLKLYAPLLDDDIVVDI